MLALANVPTRFGLAPYVCAFDLASTGLTINPKASALILVSEPEIVLFDILVMRIKVRDKTCSLANRDQFKFVRLFCL